MTTPPIALQDKSSEGGSLLESLQTENASLKLRLVQLEEALRAIRGDEVDGLVLAGPRGERLFILEGADRVYRQLIEEMGEGAITLSSEGVVLYANKAFSQMVSAPLNHLASSRVQSFFAPEAQEALQGMLMGAVQGRQSSELDLVSSRDLRLAVLVSVGPLNLPDVPGALCMVVTDLTERKRTQAEIEAREVLMNLVKRQQITQNELTLSLDTLQLRDNALACISQGVLITDSLRRTTYVNPAFEAITGYSSADMRGKSCAILQGVGTNTQTLRNLTQALNEKQPVTVELLNYRKDGTAFWNELSIAPVFDAAGTLTQFVGVQRDVTQRRESQAQLALAAKMFEQGNEAFVIMDARRTMLKVNRAFRAITGFTEGDVLGQPFDMLNSAQTDDLYYQSKRQAVETLGHWQGEIFKRFKDGSSHPQWLSMSRLVDETGATCNYIASFIDITERQRTQDALRESQRRLAGVIESAMDAIVSVDGEHKVVMFNSAAEHMFGRTAANMLAQPLDCLIPAQYRAGHGQHISQFGSTGRTSRAMGTPGALGELNAVRANGEEFPIEASISQVVIDGEKLFTVIVRDITQRKQAEAALIAAKEAAESANVAKSQFLATMSHEIRTPLNVMKGMAYAMRRTGLAPQQEECLSHIDAASAHLLSIVSDVLDLAKIDARKVELEQLEINVGQIATGTVDMLRGNALLKNITLGLEMQAAPSPLLGDATRLRQALLNYLNNALKFTETGTITLRVRVEEEFEAHTRMRFEVQDTGIGISAQTVARLFTPFEQADNSDTRQHGGTGLGLVITKRIAELMGGSAGVESVPGLGSTFWFTALLQKPEKHVPALASGAVTAQIDSSPGQLLQRDFAGTRILLAEDDSTTRMIFLDLFEETGLIVDTATDGTFAVEKAANQAYALIVMDMQMPKMSGLEATRLIRATASGKHIPIIMLTGNVFEETKRLCFEAGANDFVNKPVEAEDLFDFVLKWLTAARDTQFRQV